MRVKEESDKAGLKLNLYHHRHTHTHIYIYIYIYIKQTKIMASGLVTSSQIEGKR